MTQHPAAPAPRLRASRRFPTALTLAAALGLGAFAAATPAAAAAPCPATQGLACAPAGGLAMRVPGTPVRPLPQVNQSVNGGTNPIVGSVPQTARIGTPDRGVVPVVGAVAARADDGAYVAYETRVDTRTVDLMIVSPALAGAVPVRLRLPPSWSAAPNRTYPSLYLLPGASEKADYQSWSLYSQADRTIGAAEVLLVSPSVGSVGYATNWVAAPGGYHYDTFLSRELPQLLRRGYRATAVQAVAGVSTGGYSAFALAALHPGAYVAAASYSGVLDPLAVSPYVALGLQREGLDPLGMWGDPVLSLPTWLQRDPAYLAGHLRGVALFASAGNGQPGPLDPPGTQPDVLDPLTLLTSQSMATRLAVLGIPITTDFYGNGTHSWPYWNRELLRSWPALRASLGLAR